MVFPRFGGKKWRRSEHAHASYPGLFFRPPGFSPYMGWEERRVQGLDYLRSRETPLGPGAKKDGCFRRLLGTRLISIRLGSRAHDAAAKPTQGHLPAKQLNAHDLNVETQIQMRDPCVAIL